MKELARVPVINRDRFLHHLLKNKLDLKVAFTDWRNLGDSSYQYDARLRHGNCTIHYVNLGRNSFGLLDFEDSRIGKAEEAVVWVEDTFGHKHISRKIKLIMERYADSPEKIDDHGRSDLLTMQAICHRDASTKESCQRAIEISKKALAANPRQGRAWNCQGAAYSSLRKSKKAIGCYINAISVEPGLLRPWVNLGNRYSDLEDKNRSLFAYRIATRLKPRVNGDQEVLNKAIDNLASTGDQSKEVGHLLSQRNSDLGQLITGLSTSPTIVDMYPRKPLSIRRMKLREERLKLLKEKVDKESPSAMTLYDMAMALARLERYEEALNVCNRVLADAPNHVAAIEMRILLLMRLNRTDELLEYCDRALEELSPNPGVFLARALTEDGLKKPEEATQTFWHFISISGEEAQDFKNYALRRLQEFEYWRCVGIDPTPLDLDVASQDPVLFDVASFPANPRSPLIEARERHLFDLLKPRYSVEKEDPHPVLSEGMLKIANGEWQDALGLFDTLLSNEPDNARALHLKTYCHFHLEQFTEAGECSDVLLKRHPDQADAHALRAELLIEKALRSPALAPAVSPFVSGAMEHFNKAVTLDGRNPRVLYMKALTEDALGLKDEAFMTFAQFLAVRPGDEGYHAIYTNYRLRELAAFGVEIT